MNHYAIVHTDANAHRNKLSAAIPILKKCPKDWAAIRAAKAHLENLQNYEKQKQRKLNAVSKLLFLLQLALVRFTHFLMSYQRLNRMPVPTSKMPVTSKIPMPMSGMPVPTSKMPVPTSRLPVPTSKMPAGCRCP